MSRTNCDRNLAMLQEVAENGDEIPLGETGNPPTVIENVDGSTLNYENFMNKCLQGCYGFIKISWQNVSGFIRKFWKLIGLIIALLIILYIIYYRFLTMHLYDLTSTTQYDENTWTRISSPDVIISETVPRESLQILSQKLRKKRSTLHTDFLTFVELNSNDGIVKRCKKDNWKSQHCEELFEMLTKMNDKIDGLSLKFEQLNRNNGKHFRPNLATKDSDVSKAKLVADDASNRFTILFDKEETTTERFFDLTHPEVKESSFINETSTRQTEELTTKDFDEGVEIIEEQSENSISEKTSTIENFDLTPREVEEFSSTETSTRQMADLTTAKLIDGEIKFINEEHKSDTTTQNFDLITREVEETSTQPTEATTSSSSIKVVDLDLGILDSLLATVTEKRKTFPPENFNDSDTIESSSKSQVTKLIETSTSITDENLRENPGKINFSTTTIVETTTVSTKNLTDDSEISFSINVSKKGFNLDKENFIHSDTIESSSKSQVTKLIETSTSITDENLRENSGKIDFSTTTIVETTTVSTENLTDDSEISSSINVSNEITEMTPPDTTTSSLIAKSHEEIPDLILQQSRVSEDSFSPISETIKTSQQLKFNPTNFDPKPICFYRNSPQFDPQFLTSENFFAQAPAPVPPQVPFTNYPVYPSPLQSYNPVPYPFSYNNFYNPETFARNQFNPYSAQFLPYYCSFPQFPAGKLDEHSFFAKSQPVKTSFRSFDQIGDEDVRETNVNCPEGSRACADGTMCIKTSKWCDGETDCVDISDEIACSCKTRIDVARLCDGYFDCPNGEDELGCFGCPLTAFSCNDWNNDRKERATCVAMSQRCDGTFDCPNGQDEAECSSLMPIISQHQIFHVSYSSGFLHRNFHGQWYPVCFDSQPNHRWALEACANEVGPETMSPIYKTLQVPGSYLDPFVHQVVHGEISVIPSCLNALHVQCPPLICGTRLNVVDRPRIASMEDIRFKRSLDGPEDILGEGRVVGGTASKPAAWPWVIALYRNGLFHCGGVLISDLWVLTAAHCVIKYWQHYYEVQAGMLRRFSYSPMEQIRPISVVVIHESYDRSSMKNDLALLKLQTPLHFNRWVRPVCLPSEVTAGSSWLWGPEPDTLCTAVGWGATVEHGPDPDHIRQVEVPILSKCKHREDQEGAEICAGFEEGGRDACQGDSGGPLLCPNPKSPKQWYVAGIVSHGEGCARPDEPGVYTRVSLYLNWISKNIDEASMRVTKRPLATCPGLTCASNGGKCIPRRQKCDNTIQCLMAEDEMNCQNVKKMPDLIRETLNSLLMAKNPTTATQQNDRSKSEEILATTAPKPTTFSLFKNDDLLMNDEQEKREEKLKNTTKEANQGNLTTVMFNASNTESIFMSDLTSSKSFTDDITVVPTTDASTDTTLNISSTTSSVDSMEVNESSFESTTKNPLVFTSSNADTTLTSTTGSFRDSSIITSVTTSSNDDSLETHNSTFESTTEISERRTTEITLIGPTEKMLVVPVWPEDLHFSNENEIEAPLKIVLPELQYFTCTKLRQLIPMELRCDKKFDCEDGSDELNCLCKEVLRKTHPESICDGFLDCFDHSDEDNCFNCSVGYFYCRLSQKCVASTLRCDGKFDCHYKEDERDCYTLTDGNEVHFDDEARPRLSRSGIVSTNKNNTWYPLCYDHWDQTAPTMASEICNYLGYLSFEAHQKQRVKLQPLNGQNLTKHNNPLECDGLLVSCTPEIISKKEDFKVATFNHNKSELDSYDWPWLATIFLEGDLICSGILIYPHWIITSNTCTENINLKFDYVTTLLGMGKGILNVRNPFEQIRVVDEIIRLDKADISLLHLTEAVELSHHVQVLPLRNIQTEAGTKDICVTVGIDKFSTLKSILLQPVLLNCNPEKRCFKQISSPDACNNSTRSSWSGAIFCLSPTVGWYPSVIYHSNKGICSFLTTRMYTSVASVLKQIKTSIRVRIFHKNTPLCNGLRCDLGNCISIEKICDGNPHCRSHEDETSESCTTRVEICSKTNECECVQSQLRCSNGKCVDKSRFCDFVDDCGDRSDEPELCNCRSYLNLTRPDWICDGNLNCRDKQDEIDCGCDESSFKCSQSGKCVPKDLICDGDKDCPDGEDEQHCLGLKSGKNEPWWQGYVYERAFGIWHAKCFTSSNLTMYEREDICTGLGAPAAQKDVIEARPAIGGELLHPVADPFPFIHINQWYRVFLRPNTQFVTIKNRTDSCLLLKMICF